MLHVTTPDFAPGDVVVLASGGLPMTVQHYCTECDEVSTIWFDGGEEAGWFGPYEGEFDAALLEVIS